MQERLQKILSARGIASRRKAEEYIEQGLVKVNGKIAKVGDKADPEVDEIAVDGKVLQARQEMLYYVMHKPVGVVTENVNSLTRLFVSSESGPSSKRINESTNQRKMTVRDLLPKDLQGKIFPVGRLDKDSSGLLLFTNDGVLAYRLTHPGFSHEKEYEVVLDRTISALACKKIEEGFEMDGSMTKPLKCKKIAPNMVRIVLTEGRNRQIRRMCQHVGYTVKALKRVRIMTLEDSTLKPGHVRLLTEQERAALLASVKL